MFNHLKKVNVDFFSVSDFYLFCKKSNRRLLFNNTVFFVFFCFWSFVSIKEVRNGYKGGGGHVLFAKYNFNWSYIFIKKFLFSYIIFVKSGSTPCTKWLSPSYSDCIFFKTFFTVSKPKATNSRVSDCYLTSNSAIFSCIMARSS